MLVTSVVIYRSSGGLVTMVYNYVLAVFQVVKVKKRIEHHNGLHTPLARTPPWCFGYIGRQLKEFENHSDGYLSGYIIPLWSLGHIDKLRNRNFPSGSNSKRG